MKRELKHFYETVGVLINAYMKDQLYALDCSACACGNIAAHFRGYTLVRADFGGFDWKNQYGQFHAGKLDWEVESVPYTREELSIIEARFVSPYSFGYGHWYREIIDQNFYGLCAVFDYLEELYGLQGAKENFINQFQTLKW